MYRNKIAAKYINIVDRNGNGAVHKLLNDKWSGKFVYKRAQLLSDYIKFGFEFDRPNYKGNTPLHLSACGFFEKSDLDCTNILINNRAQIDAINYKGYTPLFNAVNTGTLEIIKKLVENGANINHVDLRGNSLLHHTGKCINSILFFSMKPAIKNNIFIMPNDYESNSEKIPNDAIEAIMVWNYLVESGCEIKKNNIGQLPIDSYF